MNKKKKVVISGLAMTLAAGAGTGAALAYLTDGEKAENTFTIGDVSIEGVEPHYPGNDSDDVKDIVPNEEVPKDPQIDNNGVNDAIVFMTVDSPLEDVTIINDDGTTGEEKGVNEIFWFKDANDNASVHANNFDAGWQRLPAKEMYVKIAADESETLLNETTPAALKAAYDALDDGEHIVKRYVFGYKTPVQGSTTHDGSAQTAENKITAPLFDKVQLKNVLENEIDETVEKVVVRSYAIQSSEILENNTDLGENLDETNLGKIYDIYIRQNSVEDDASGLKVEGLRGSDDLSPTSNGASGTTDLHRNRFGTDDDVTAEGQNKNPNEGETSPLAQYAGEYATPGGTVFVRTVILPDGSVYDCWLNASGFTEEVKKIDPNHASNQITVKEEDYLTRRTGMGETPMSKLEDGSFRTVTIIKDGDEKQYYFVNDEPLERLKNVYVKHLYYKDEALSEPVDENYVPSDGEVLYTASKPAPTPLYNSVQGTWYGNGMKIVIGTGVNFYVKEGNEWVDKTADYNIRRLDNEGFSFRDVNTQQLYEFAPNPLFTVMTSTDERGLILTRDEPGVNDYSWLYGEWRAFEAHDQGSFWIEEHRFKFNEDGSFSSKPNNENVYQRNGSYAIDKDYITFLDTSAAEFYKYDSEKDQLTIGELIFERYS